MGFFDKLGKLFSSSGGGDKNAYWITVKCNRCGETIRTRVNLMNDLSAQFEAGDQPVYFCRKTLMGEGRCFQRVEVELTFDQNRHLVNREISGGQFIDE
jgi:hypothetical protein